ncbi:putative addiction module antidote protein [Roseibium sp. TrichSKD4]|uniref:addiction module antidote protein n=1 Tax=Roseibium sp. TrichSKD4 TaxID=744980 RepID=UPI0001E56FD0|nr:addiction module antidote protein [Roseibium sp. TrichSKD4]EFO31353.1 putative addiction module antidote protein [Roseibium sp. TrichSKD4]
MSATKIDTLPEWNIQDQLETPEAVAAYLEAAFDDGDPQAITTALGDVAKAKGMAAIAGQAGITREGLYKALSKKGDPRLSTLLGVFAALGLRLTAAPVSPAE